MQAQSAVPRQRLASLNDLGQRPAAVSTPVPAPAPAPGATSEVKQTTHDTQPYITEDFTGFLGGGPFNRFALALKSGLDNEIDWACARLVAATQRAPEEWGVVQYAPFLVEAVVSALGKARHELQQHENGSAKRARVHISGGAGKAMQGARALVADAGPAMQGARARERAELLATVLYNVAQVGENAAQLAQDARVVIEATKWLQSGLKGCVRVRAELLDVLDAVVPQLAAQTDVRVGAWSDAVETRLWAELVRMACTSTERAEVLGAVRVMVQAVAWHPHVARAVLELPAPRGVVGAGSVAAGSVVSARAMELVLSPDADVVGAALELLLNTVRLEAMARALDAERASVRRAESPASGSGTQTPVFGLRAQARAAEAESAPSMLPDGMAALVALVLQQWMAAVCPPPTVPPPLMAASTAASGTRQAASAQASGSRPPTEPELREACTWVLLNYEFVAPPQQQQQQQQQTPQRPLFVSINDMFSRYTIAKQGQTAPRIGRALSLSEIVRVVAAVFPRATVQAVSVPQRAPGQASETTVALHLRQKTQHIVPIPELPPVPVDASAASKDATPGSANSCGWTGCSHAFADEDQALQHLREHVRGADACRWRGCNRIPREHAEQSEIEPWLVRHVLAHGPFVRDTSDEPKPAAAEESSGPVSVSDAEKLGILGLISPPFADDVSGQAGQQQVLRLVLQGVGVVEQLQRWADRRVGPCGERDRVRVWRCGDDVLERVAFIAAQSSPIAVYAARLLAAISKQNVL